MHDNSWMSDNEPTSEHGPQPDHASWGLSGELLSSGSGGSGGDVLASGPIERPRHNLAAIVVSLIAVLAVRPTGLLGKPAQKRV